MSSIETSTSADQSAASRNAAVSRLHRGISVRWCLGALTFGALAAAALMSPWSYWAPAVTEAALLFQVAAICVAVCGDGQRRAFACGYAIGSGLMLTAEFVPVLGKPLIHRLAPWTLWSTDSFFCLGEPTHDRAYVGIILSAILYGYFGAIVARWAYVTRSVCMTKSASS